MPIRNDTEVLLQEILGNLRVSWYKRKKTKKYLPSDITTPVSGIDIEDISRKEFPNQKISDNPDLFINQGQIAMLIKPTTGVELQIALDHQSIRGQFHGTCGVEYDIGIDDHIVDNDDYEYIVMNVYKSASKEYIGVEMNRFEKGI